MRAAAAAASSLHGHACVAAARRLAVSGPSGLSGIHLAAATRRQPTNHTHKWATKQQHIATCDTNMQRAMHTRGVVSSAGVSSSPSSSSPSASSSASSPSGGTAIVMLNMGGPSTVSEVGPFLRRLFSDGDIITLGRLQSWLGPLLAQRRTPAIEKQYQQIGGSQIKKWTQIQGEEMCKRLDKISPETAPHKFYIAFRYADPLTESALRAMHADGMTRAVAFSQYPQFSCTTTGSSLNHLWREVNRLNMEKQFKWSIIDRWHEHPLFIDAVVNRIKMAMEKFPAEERDKVIILFSAHSLPMKVVNRSDPYPQEVGSTVAKVMTRLGYANRYMLAWQSQVGPLPWLGPQTGEVIQGFAQQGHRNLMVVPIAFTSDHVETLFEIDIEYAHVAAEAGITNFFRAPSLNDEPLIFDAFADLVKTHLTTGELHTPQYTLNCAGCVNPICRSICNPIKPYEKMRDQATGRTGPLFFDVEAKPTQQ